MRTEVFIFPMFFAGRPDTTVRLTGETSFAYPGWRVAVISHIGVLTGFATVFIYSFSFMVQPLQHQFGWSREQISRAFSLAAISVAICSPIVGRLFDRVEPRKLIAAMMATFGLGLLSLAYLTADLHRLYLSSIFIGIAGTGTYQLGFARIVTGWFERRLGDALSLVVAGSGVGSLLIPPLTQQLIQAYGWRHAYMVLAGLPLCIGAPLTLLFARSARFASQGPETSVESSGLSVLEAMGFRSFWLLALGVCALSLSENGALAHLAPMMSDHRFSSREIALTATILGASSVIGRLVLGCLLDYLNGSHIAVASLIAAGSGILLLAHAQTFSRAAPAAFFAGLGAGCELDLVPYMLRRYFGMKSFTGLYGLVYTFFALAGAIAPLIAGRVFDSTGSYNGILTTFCAVTLAAAIAMFALPGYRFTAADAPAPSGAASQRAILETN